REVRTSVVSSSRDLLELARREPPDVIVLDERLEALGSQILLSLLRRDCPGARIVLLLPEKSRPDVGDPRARAAVARQAAARRLLRRRRRRLPPQPRPHPPHPRLRRDGLR